ncbi:MAG: citramalate synthase [bacterium]|nr:citramalate synthase [bacterium]
MSSVVLFDTTLRDGTQGEHVSLSLNDKLRVAQRLDEFGAHYVEGGWPGSNPKDAGFFERARDLNLKHAKLVAFGSTRRKNSACEDDANLKALLEAETSAVAVVGKSWDFHVERVLETTLEENLQMIFESVRYLKDYGREVVFDAEHFVDGFKANPGYALQVAEAAAVAGADYVVICDTNGGSMPWEVEDIVRQVAERVEAKLGIHAHNDSGCGVANSVAAVRGGCAMVQGTVNGYGERVGNADLMAIVPNLQLKMGKRCVEDEQLAKLTELSRFLDDLANLEHDTRAPYVGRSAFAHKGGIHVAAMLKADTSYQHVDPQLVGNASRCLVSELSGRGNIAHLAAVAGVDSDRKLAGEVLEQVKDLESRGYSFESAEATVELMMKRAEPDYAAPFDLIDFMVIVERREGRGMVAEATVKVRVGSEVVHTVAEGNGPVHALSLALRQALRETYPDIDSTSLVDYKVRTIDGEQGTAATIRVLVEYTDGERHWSTVGASTNIIEASWIALADALEYVVTKQQYPVRQRVLAGDGQMHSRRVSGAGC